VKVWELLAKPIGVVGGAFETAFKFGKDVVNFIKGIGKGAFGVAGRAFEVLAVPIQAIGNALQRVKDLWEWLKRNVQGTGGNPLKGLGQPGANVGGGTGGVVITGPQELRGIAQGLGMAGMGGRPVINVQVSAGLVSTPDQVGQQIIEAIQRAQRRSGPAFAPA